MNDSELQRLLEAVKSSLQKDGWQVQIEPFSPSMLAIPSDFKATQNALPLRLQVRLSADVLA